MSSVAPPNPPPPALRAPEVPGGAVGLGAASVPPSVPVAATAPTRAPRRWPGGRGGRVNVLLGAALGILVTAVSVHSASGQLLKPSTQVEIALQLIGGVVLVLALLAGPAARRLPGGAVVALMAALAAYTAVSIMWAVEPSDAWAEANQAFTYLMVLAAAVALVRLAPERWAAVVGATVVAAGALSVIALACKVFPAWLAPNDSYARLREPFEYWNAVGLVAAMGVPGCLWWGTRKEGHAGGRALSAPVMAILLLVLTLSYSRGALVAALVGAVAWFVLVPARLRSVALLGIAGLGALLVSLWVFGQDTLEKDKVPLDASDVSGHRLGLFVLAMLVVVSVAYLAVAFFASRRPLEGERRRRAGIAVLVVVALVPLALLGRLAVSDRGLTGSISHNWTQLTDPHAATPPNDASRLTAVGSVRSRYWNDALKMWQDKPWLGVGAGGYVTVRPRYREDTLHVRDAHGYVVQTLADLGIVGLAISLAAMVAWLVAAGRAMGGWRAGRSRQDPERTGMAALVCAVIVFGVDSFVDWTWFIPGCAVFVLLCAGWVAGRGRLDEPLAPPRPFGAALKHGVRQPMRVAGAVFVVALTLAMAWTTWQPQRAVSSGDAAVSALAAGNLPLAQKEVQSAQHENPLSIDPLLERSAIELRAGNVPAARAALEQAVRLQPANPLTWLSLAQFEVANGNPQAAIDRLGSALFLDPHAREVQQTFLQARAALAASAAAAAAAAAAKPHHHKG